jgi:hypothetical protein
MKPGITRFLKLSLVAAALSWAAVTLAGLAAGDAREPWVAFRYNATTALFYVAQPRDTVGFTPSELADKQLPQPIARWGKGGYLMSLPKERLSALQPSLDESLLRSLNHDEPLTIRLSARETVIATCDGFIEQWGGSNPQVQIGVLARIATNELPKFRSNSNDYFLAYKGAEPSIQAQPRHEEIVGPRHLLNKFGSIGELIVVEGDDGWSVALWRRFSDKLMPTGIAYSYGD